MKKDTCALICAYNEQDAIAGVIGKTQKYVDAVIVVDDGSRDKTNEIARNSGAITILHEYNHGKGRALQSGFTYFLNSKYENVVTLDADGQHSPESIPDFMEALDKGYDAAIGHRDFKGTHVPKSRRFANKIGSYILSKLLHTNLPDTQNGFRIFKRKTLEDTLEEVNNSGFPFEIELLIKMVRHGMKIGWVPIETIYDKKIKSHIKPINHVREFIGLYYKVYKGKI